MTGPAHFQVEPNQLRAHAGTVGDVASGLSDAAGGGGGLTDNALGTFVQFLTAGLQDATNKTTASIAHASSAVGNVRAGLVDTADRYQGTDQDNAGRLNGADHR
ncbi:MAG TPA: type VII secretion target [Pseudonocardiaceae bacterium]|jgi:hypothetical protein|nr:type VII secretion target [Pseudonocardiaceae bacterium]